MEAGVEVAGTGLGREALLADDRVVRCVSAFVELRDGEFDADGC